jgi:probable blue pigment (indigoidine) exporter
VILIILLRQLPSGAWWWKVFILGGLNFTIFFSMLFVTAYRLPGGVAATVGAIQPLVVIILSRFVLGAPLKIVSIVAAIAGVAGVALLVLTPKAALDPIGIAAGLFGAAAMAVGIVLTRLWRPPVSALTFTAWQLTAGGLLLVPLALGFEPPLPALTFANIAALAFLAVIGGALAYMLWFRGIAILGANTASPLSLLSPVVAVLVGWLALHQTLSLPQTFGILIVLASVWAGQRSQRPPVARPASSAATDAAPL